MNGQNRQIKPETLDKKFSYSFTVRECLILTNILLQREYNLEAAKVLNEILDKFKSNALVFTEDDYVQEKPAGGITPSPIVT